jgi:hypothetical protein
MLVIMKLDDETLWSTEVGKRQEMDSDWEDSSDDILARYPDGWFTPEREGITLPSALAPGEIARQSLQPIAMIEAELRKGQVTDALEGLRLALGEKSLCFRAEVRNANSQRTTLRAWDKVHKFDADARQCRSTYRYARSALQRLHVEPEYLATLHDITDNDMKVAGDLTDEGRFNQRSDSLAWFWRVGQTDESAHPRMQECMSECRIVLICLTDLCLVYRVSWLRAKARYSRWSEEFRIVGYEMRWTVNWFRWKGEQWRLRLDDMEDEERPPGLDCYCHKQMTLWTSLANEAENQFASVLGHPL